MESKVLIGYWKVRGKAEIARQLLALNGIDSDEKNYVGDAE